MVQPVYELTEWLEAQKGNTLMIHKGELSIGKQEIVDINKVELRLDKIVLKNIERSDPDNYLANQEVILHGQGTIRSDYGEVELPQNVYEIPIYGNVTTHKVEHGLKIETERAVYSIHIQEH